jgi:hypothetical protein
MESFRKVASWAIGVVGAMIAIGAQVSPETATSNLSGWAKLLGLNWLSLHLPSYADSIGTVLGALLIVAAIGLTFLIRRRRKVRTAVALFDEPDLDWLPVLAAIDAFCDPKIVKLRDSYLKTIEATISKIFQNDEQIRVCEAQEGNGTEEPRHEATKQHGELLIMRTHLEHMQELGYSGVKDVWKTLRDDMGDRLLAGELVAKGVPEPYAAGAREIAIRQAEWQSLQIQPSDASAVRKSDLKPVYSALQIARPSALTAAAPSPQSPQGTESDRRP